MRSYQVVQFNTPIICNEITDPVPEGKEVVVDVITCGLCHSDVHFHEGHVSLGGGAILPAGMLGIKPPTSLGHEIFGRISAFGPDAGLDAEDIGRPVVVYPWIGCGTCDACRAERDNECQSPRSIGVQLPGGHAEKVVVREPKYLVAADGLNEESAGIFACCGLTAYSALAKIPRRDGWIGIIGAGGVGTMTLSIEKGIHQSKVAIFDINPAKLAAAIRNFEADKAIDSRDEIAVEALKEETKGFVGVLDFVGSQQTVELGVSLLRNGGTYVGVGLFGGMLQLPLAVVASRQLSIRGSYCGSLAELRSLVEYARTGRIRSIPTTVAPMEAINQGLEELKAGKIDGRLVHRHAHKSIA